MIELFTVYTSMNQMRKPDSTFWYSHIFLFNSVETADFHRWWQNVAIVTLAHSMLDQLISS